MLGAATGTLDRIVALSRELGQAVGDVGGAFARFQIAADDIGITSEQTEQLTETILKLGRIGGASSQELTSGMIQLAQGLASGVLRGQELNSVMEQMPLVARAIADELGVSIGQLRKMGAEGKITGDIVTQAMFAATEKAREAFEQLPRTIEQKKSEMATAWTQLLAELDRQTRASAFYKNFIGGLTRAIDTIRIQLQGSAGSNLETALARTQERLAALRELYAAGDTSLQRQIDRAERLEQQLLGATERYRSVIELADLEFNIDSGTGGPAAKVKALSDEMQSAQQELREFKEELTDLEAIYKSLLSTGRPESALQTERFQEARQVLRDLADTAEMTDKSVTELEAAFGITTAGIYDLITSKQDLEVRIERVTTGFTKLEGRLDPWATQAAEIAEQNNILAEALDVGRISAERHEELVDRLIRQHEQWEAGLEQTALAVERQVGALETENEVAEINLDLRDASADRTLELTLRIIDLREEQQLLNLEFEREKSLLEALPEHVDRLNRHYDALRDGIEDSFDIQRLDAFETRNRSVAEEFQTDWTGAIDAVQSLFDQLFGKVFDRLGVFGDLIKGIASDVVRQVTGGLSLGQLAVRGVGSLFGADVGTVAGGGGAAASAGGAGGDFLNGLNFIRNLGSLGSSIGSGLTSAGTFLVENVPGVASSMFAANPALANIASGAGGEAALNAALGGVAGSQLAVFAPAVGGLLAGIVSGFMRRAEGDGPAFGARFGVNAAGRLENVALGVDDGFSEETARIIADQTQGIANAFLAASGLRIAEGGFRGEIAFNQGFFKSSADRPNNAANERFADVTGILGLNHDSRLFEQYETAIGDFVARNLFLALREGNLGGVTDANRDIYQVGLGNIVRQVRDRVVGPDALQNLADDLDFLAIFATAREAFVDLGLSADDAAGRLRAAQQSQESYNQALEAVRTEARAAVAETGSPLAHIGDFIDNARRLFDPSGGAAVQSRLRLSDRRIGIGFLAQGEQAGGLDVRNATLIEGVFDDGAGGIRIDSDFSPDPAAVASIFNGEGPSGNVPVNAAAFAGGFRFGNVTLRPQTVDFERPASGSFFIEMGRGATFGDGQGNNVQLDGSGQGNVTGLSVDADRFVEAVVGAGVEFAEVINDPLFSAGAGLILESAALAVNEIDRFFESITDQATSVVSGPLALFEEITPTVSPLVTAFESMKAQIEATRPDIEELNRDLEELGITAASADDRIDKAIADVTVATQNSFLASLGRRIDPATGEVQTGIDFVGINSVATAVKDLDATFGTLYEGIDLTALRSLLSQTDDVGSLMARPEFAGVDRDTMLRAIETIRGIDDVLVQGISDLLQNAEDPETTFGVVQDIFGDRISGFTLDDFLGLEQATVDVEAFSAALQDSVRTVDQQIATQERLVASLQGRSRALRTARKGFLTDTNLSPLTAAERRAEALRQFQDARGAIAAAATDADRLTAEQDLIATSRTFLEASRAFNASSETYQQDFNLVQTVLAEQESTLNAQTKVALDQLEELRLLRQDINDQFTAMAEGGGLYIDAGNGQFVATGLGGIPQGFDLGFQPDKAIRVLNLLRAHGFALPSGFGEGQLNAMRNADSALDLVLRANGFAEGGIMTSRGRLESGGITHQPRLALFGEGSVPEAFVPVPSGRIPVEIANDNSSRILMNIMVQQERSFARMIELLESIDGSLDEISDSDELRRAG